MEIVKTPPIDTMSGAFSVKGKNVVVTGGNRGIGFGISAAFAESGANVAILCRDGESGRSAAESLSNFGGRYTCVQADITDVASVSAAAKGVYEFFDHVDVLVNNAGVATKKTFFAPDGLDEWHRVIDTNLHGVANVVHFIVPAMKESGRGGAIINISSVGGQRVSSARDYDNAPYNASKAGLEIFTRFLAVTLGDFGLRCNVISPGPTHSGLKAPPSFIEMVEKKMPAHRFGEPIEIGALCVFLASPAGVHLTGATIPLDGGLLTVV